MTFSWRKAHPGAPTRKQIRLRPTGKSALTTCFSIRSSFKSMSATIDGELMSHAAHEKFRLA
jgi:hypothetical protein